MTQPMIIGPLNLAKAPTLTQCGSGKQTFCSNNNSSIASNNKQLQSFFFFFFSADLELNSVVQTLGQIVLNRSIKAR